jgi:hypothetical protein
MIQPAPPPEPAQPTPQQELPQVAVPVGEQLMQLSLQALHGMPGEGTLSVQITIGGKHAMALIDTGSTNTFLDAHFAKGHQQHLIPIPHRKVLVAGGGELNCQSILPQCGYTIQGTTFTHDFHILPLKGYDVILGSNWLKRFSLNFIHWEKRSVSINNKGQWLTLVDKQVT